jgi:hypothetical protein
MPKHKNSKGTRAIVSISHKAKAIRKEHPSMKWTTAIKQASAEYRKKH